MKRQNKAKYLTWNSRRLEFLKETSMLNSVQRFVYIKCCSSRKSRPIKSPSGSIRNNCEKIFSWSWSPETFRSSVFYQEDLKPYWKSKTATFLEGWISLLFASFLKDFVDHRKKTKRTVIFSCRPLDNILEDRDRRWNIQTIWKTRFLETHFEDFIKVVWKFWLTVLQNHRWNKIRTKCLW